MTLRPPALPALLPLVLLAACATPPDTYPSLAIRDVERISGTAEPAPPAYVPPPTPAATLGRLEAIAAEAQTTQAAFLEEASEVRRIVAAARGTEPGSENWARAQVAIAGLESARSRALLALADLDRLYVDARLEGAELARIEAAQQALSGQVDQQNAAIDELLQSLRP